MNEQDANDLETLLRGCAPRIKTTEAMNKRLLRRLRSASAYQRLRRRWVRSIIAAAAAILLLAIAGGLVFRTPQAPPPCYVGKAESAAMEPIIPPYAEHDGVSYGITAGEYEIVIADVAL